MPDVVTKHFKAHPEKAKNVAIIAPDFVLPAYGDFADKFPNVLFPNEEQKALIADIRDQLGLTDGRERDKAITNDIRVKYNRLINIFLDQFPEGEPVTIIQALTQLDPLRWEQQKGGKTYVTPDMFRPLEDCAALTSDLCCAGAFPETGWYPFSRNDDAVPILANNLVRFDELAAATISGRRMEGLLRRAYLERSSEATRAPLAAEGAGLTAPQPC